MHEVFHVVTKFIVAFKRISLPHVNLYSSFWQSLSCQVLISPILSLSILVQLMGWVVNFLLLRFDKLVASLHYGSTVWLLNLKSVRTAVTLLKACKSRCFFIKILEKIFTLWTACVIEAILLKLIWSESIFVMVHHLVMLSSLIGIILLSYILALKTTVCIYLSVFDCFWPSTALSLAILWHVLLRCII